MELIPARLQNVVIPETCKDGCNDWFANLASIHTSSSCTEHFRKRLKLLDLDHIEELPATEKKVNTNPLRSCLSELLQRVLQEFWHLSHWSTATSTASTCFAALLDKWDCVSAFILDGLLNLCLCQAQAATDEIIIGKAGAISSIGCWARLARWWPSIRQALWVISTKVILS